MLAQWGGRCTATCSAAGAIKENTGLHGKPGCERLAAVITVTLYPVLVGVTLITRGAAPARTLTIAGGAAMLAVVVLLRHALAYRRERRRSA